MTTIEMINIIKETHNLKKEDSENWFARNNPIVKIKLCD